MLNHYTSVCLSMVDIISRFDDARELTRQFYQLEGELDVQISWGQKSDQFPTNDPFKTVRIRDNRVILKHTVDDDPIWYIDVVKGVIAYYLPASLQDTWSGWNFATLVALLLIKTTELSDGRKTEYSKTWLKINENLQKGRIRYHYDRWYQIFSSYNRKQVIELLQDFILRYYDETGSTLENQLTWYLHTNLKSTYNELDIEVLMTALGYQTVNAKELDQVLSSVSRSSIYRTLNRLSFHIDEYYLPLREATGLRGLTIMTEDDTVINQIQQLSYYENIESFQNSQLHLLTMWIPSPYLTDLIKTERSCGSRIFLRDVGSRYITATPQLFDTTDLSWRSAQQEKAKSITVKFPRATTDHVVSRDELLVLERVLQRRTTDRRKLSMNHSRSETKRLIRSIQKKGLFKPVVLWRPPSDLNTLVTIYRLSDWRPVKSLDLPIPPNFTEQLTIDHDLVGPYGQITGLSWPHFLSEKAIELDLLHQQFRYIDFLRLSGVDEDFDFIRQLAKEQTILGTQLSNPGILVKQPVDMMDDGQWQFDLEYFVNILCEVA